MRNIPYFQWYGLNELDKVERRIVKLKDFRHSSAAHIAIPGRGDYGIPTSADERFLNPHGAVAGFYNWDDYRPVPVKGREPDVLKPVTAMQDGKPVTEMRTIPKAKCPPLSVHRAYADDRLEKLHNIPVKSNKFRWGMYGLAIGLILLFSGLAVYYTYYFGINIACAVHAHGVNCG